ncbi:MAG: DUF4868 domain-containing protein [Spirochaetes bacterium]|nr:DUF4868 domain-containing protein [Spirochaetota bacterium]
MINSKEIRELISNDYLQDSNTFLYLLEYRNVKNDPLSLYSLNINQDIVENVKSICSEYLTDVIGGYLQEENDSIPEYNPDDKQSIFRIGSGEVGMFKDILDMATGASLCKIYKRDDVEERKLKSWVVRFECGSGNRVEEILFFQKFQTSRMLSSGKSFFIEQGDKFKLLKEKTYYLNNSMDFFYFRNTFIVTKISSFENIFNFENYYRANAVELIRELEKGKVADMNYSVTFADADAVNEKIGRSKRLAHKMHSARVNGYYKQVEFDKLVKLNKRYNWNLDLNKENKVWSIDEKSDLQVMARILNDDYERSQLTDNEYIATGKIAASPPSSS